MRKRSLDYNSLGVETIEELLVKTRIEGNERDCFPTESSDFEDTPSEFQYTDVYQEIQDILTEYQETEDMSVSSFGGIPVSCLETTYEEKFKRSLDYTSLGVETIEELLVKMRVEGMLCLYTHPESNERYACFPTEFSDTEDMPSEFQYMDVYREIQDMLIEYQETGGIPVYCLETTYEETFERSLDYNSLGVETIEELLVKMRVEGMVCLYTHPERNERYVKYACFPTESSDIEDMPSEFQYMDVYQEIQSVLTGYGAGVALYWLERRYYYEFGRAPDYSSVGVNDIKELIGKMRDKGRLLVLEEPEESKETYVMCAWMAQSAWKFLKRDVVRLLDTHGGEIPFSCFERRFKEFFKLELIYRHFGFTSLDNLCEVLHLGLEEADSAGEKVIKPCKCNVRKRKING